MKISVKVGLKIPSKRHINADKLAELLDSLKGFLSAINHGDWDQICANPDPLLKAFEAARRPEFLGAITSNDSSEVRETLTLFQLAIEKCAERKEQIAPLVNALTPTKDISDTT